MTYARIDDRLGQTHVELHERPCEECGDLTRTCFLTRAPDGCELCPVCAGLEDDPPTEPECDCRGVCRQCTPGA